MVWTIWDRSPSGRLLADCKDCGMEKMYDNQSKALEHLQHVHCAKNPMSGKVLQRDWIKQVKDNVVQNAVDR